MNKRLMVLGANGMLGGSLFRYFSKQSSFDVLGTVRSSNAESTLNRQGFSNLISNITMDNLDKLSELIHDTRPDVVLNCIGVIKQHNALDTQSDTIQINSLLPHQLAQICDAVGAKLIHFSTDCVFSGKHGGYTEQDLPDAMDLYGRSKLLGEIDYGHHLTLRTSIIGHELARSLSLVDWFLSQEGNVRGYNKAIFSGLPSIYMAEFLHHYVLDKPLQGVYHVSMEPIDKYSLLKLVKDIYATKHSIVPCSELVIDRSLSSDRIRATVDFTPPSWPELIHKMRKEYLEYFA